MTTSYLYCYSPISGQMWAQDYYCYCCNGAAHPTVFGGNWCCPLDIGGGGVADGDPMYWYMGAGPNCTIGPVISSFGIKHLSGVCLSDPAPWNDAVQVDMYKYPGGSGYVGSVLYAHVKNRAAEGIFDIPPHQAFCYAQVGQFARDCNCGCAHGIHVHMQRWNGNSRTFSCGQNLTANGSWLYYWVVTF